MFVCPGCSRPLLRGSLPFLGAPAWRCNGCGGLAMRLPVLARLRDRDGIPWLRAWQQACANGSARRVGPCPACRAPMVPVAAGPDTLGGVAGCPRCALAWCADGADTLPVRHWQTNFEGAANADEALAIEAVRARMATLREQPQGMQMVPMLLGLPIDVTGWRAGPKPWATWATAVAIAAVSLACFRHPTAVDHLELVPRQALRADGLNFLTSFFVHADPLHLLGNLWFLVVFGRAVERFVGPERWLLLLVTATIAGGIALCAFTQDPTRGVIGASGGISGLLAYHALSLPEARLSFLSLRTCGPDPAMVCTVSARDAFALWILVQAILLYQELEGFGTVAALAHLGGVAAGVAWWWWDRSREQPARVRRGRNR